MNILYAGNLANVGYYHTRNFRKHDFEIDLVMEKNPPALSDPLLRDSSITKYPKWIRLYDKNSSSWKFELIKIMRDKKYDLIHSHAEFPIFAYASRRPFISQIMGSDLREMAFSNSLRGILLRKAYRKSKLVLYSIPGDPEKLSKLKISKTLFLPVLFDVVDFFKPIQVDNGKYDSDFIIFHPTSHIWNVKGNDLLIRGFHKFLQNNPNALLIAINFGRDVKKSQELVRTLGIEKRVLFLEHLDATNLLNYYNMADIVADQFIFHGLSGIGIETFCCAKPLLTSCDEKCYLNMHPVAPPAINATTSDKICEQLEILKDNKKRQEIGSKSRQWVEQYQSPEIIFKQTKLIYELVSNNEEISEIRSQVNKLVDC